jgi:nucleotide-binding universal stress UspA family protein
MLTRFVEAARATSRHCREVLADRFADERLMLAVGSLRDCAAVHALDVDAALLVLPAGELRGREVTALARFASRPVFVHRPMSRDAGSIVAATDLTQSDYPVLRTARDLAAQGGSSIVALHALRRPRLAVAVGAQLKKVSAALGLHGAALLPARDAVSAILEEAKRRAADVIVVGTHARAPWARAIRSSVAAQVIDRAQRSVWVEPIVE